MKLRYTPSSVFQVGKDWFFVSPIDSTVKGPYLTQQHAQIAEDWYFV